MRGYKYMLRLQEQFARDKSTEACIKRAIKRLGKTKDSVANVLRKLHIKGEPGEADNCPVANYLKLICGEEIGISVTGGEVTFDTEDPYPYNKGRVSTPASDSGIYSFVRAFDERDSGESDDLEEFDFKSNSEYKILDEEDDE